MTGDKNTRSGLKPGDLVMYDARGFDVGIVLGLVIWVEEDDNEWKTEWATVMWPIDGPLHAITDEMSAFLQRVAT